MRWEGLFADLEGQLAAEERRELDDEVAERTRRERALVTLCARLEAAVGGDVRLGLLDGRRVNGDLEDLGDGWLLVRGRVGGRELLVPTASVVTVTALASHAEPGRPARRFGLGYALRALSRDRATVAVSLVGGGAAVVGTIDAVGADHLDVAEHAEGVPRRRENVTAVTTLPFGAVVAVEARR
ncbi:hypothetical protein GCM10023168_25960 [Fodinibacter luteus]|uniref:Uncharacterized protein n=1 Tax=Fodinibacter luteus TaxID=552064 RepID=A0ABP8KK10_9MICO